MTIFWWHGADNGQECEILCVLPVHIDIRQGETVQVGGHWARACDVIRVVETGKTYVEVAPLTKNSAVAAGEIVAMIDAKAAGGAE